MVDKVVARANLTRKNWYEAFKMGMMIKGYEYYEIPGEIRYRYPAPGSVALDSKSYPHLFKKHWKTPFRDSHFNIRQQEKQLTIEENTDHYISGLVEYDPVTEPHKAGEQKPKTDDLIVVEHPPLDSEEMVAELWADFDKNPEKIHVLKRDYAPYAFQTNDDYNQV